VARDDVVIAAFPALPALVHLAHSEVAVGTLAADVENARRFASNATSAGTQKAYKRDLGVFEAWCRDRGIEPFPAAPAAVAAFISHLAARGLKAGTIRRHLSSISVAHRVAGEPSPTVDPGVKTTWVGLKRTIGTAVTRKSAATVDEIVKMLEHMGSRPIDVRDRAMLLLGFAGALRRSELCALDVEDLVLTERGYDLRIRKSKTDQLGEGCDLQIARGSHTCPITAVQRWLDLAGISSGPIFRGVNRHGNVSPTRLTDQQVARTIKKRCRPAGLDPALFSGHSLRAGCCTQMARDGSVSTSRAMQHSRHRSVPIFSIYVREASKWRDPVSGHLGL
jgi:integrase